MTESKEYIKARMLKNVARAWGFSETEPESNFDPLVGMLLTACSIELEKISGDIHNSRARVLERLVQLLTPDVLTGALPAHAIATAQSIQEKFEVREDNQYYFTPKSNISAEGDETADGDIYFSPSANFEINRAAIRFMAVGNLLYKTNHATKELVAQSEPDKDMPASSLWLGIDEPGLSLQGTMFYFDLRNEEQKQLFYHQLPKATWYWSDQPIDHAPGFGNRSISGEQLDLETILNRNDDISGNIRKNVNAFYKPCFITLLDKDNLTASAENSMLSGMVHEAFGTVAAKQLQEHSLRWICIDFPKTIPTHLLQEVVCNMNCFPVINRELHSFTHRLQEVVNIIPLNTENIFLDIEEVSTDDGKPLNVRGIRGNDSQSAPVLFRSGGVGRFDERDAASLVEHIVQLLRDESAAFSTLGNDLDADLTQLQQIINRLEQRLFAQQLAHEQIPYLVLRTNAKNSWQNVFVRYWSTVGAKANNIKAGNALYLYRGRGIKNNQLNFVTTTQGGRNKLSTSESVLTYKSALLSKDRLITEEDIKAFCHYLLGNKVNKIEVRKGIMVHPDQQQGFMKTIDVMIEINKKEYDVMKEREQTLFWSDNLKMLLEQKSVALFPYRVFLQRAA